MEYLSYIDCNGSILKSGDIVMQLFVGGGRDSLGEYNKMRLWEVPEIKDGRGIHYANNGTAIEYYTVNPQDSILLVLSELPLGFIDCFKKGMNTIKTRLDDGFITDYINNSDWEDYK